MLVKIVNQDITYVKEVEQIEVEIVSLYNEGVNDKSVWFATLRVEYHTKQKPYVSETLELEARFVSNNLPFDDWDTKVYVLNADTGKTLDQLFKCEVIND